MHTNANARLYRFPVKLTNFVYTLEYKYVYVRTNTLYNTVVISTWTGRKGLVAAVAAKVSVGHYRFPSNVVRRSRNTYSE